MPIATAKLIASVICVTSFQCFAADPSTLIDNECARRKEAELEKTLAPIPPDEEVAARLSCLDDQFVFRKIAEGSASIYSVSVAANSKIGKKALEAAIERTVTDAGFKSEARPQTKRWVKIATHPDVRKGAIWALLVSEGAYYISVGQDAVLKTLFGDIEPTPVPADAPSKVTTEAEEQH